MTIIPPLFAARMREQLPKEEQEAFFASLQEPSVQGLRYNPTKWSREEFLSKVPFQLNPVPWCGTGYYYNKLDRPGKHPYHAAGLYYIQEPSAMAVIETLCPQPGERVLDLCAAPGGKATQISGYLANEGLLVANEFESSRAKILAENLERWGATNALITNEKPENLAERFPAFFDKIVVDAPCSGEGMFRKLQEAGEDWSLEKVGQCAAMQKDILDAAAIMLRPGGTMVYSTCTFAPDENEKQIEAFLHRHPEFSIEVAPTASYFKEGTTPHTLRLWPHHLRGEGHFITRLRHNGEIVSPSESVPKKGKSIKEKKLPSEALNYYSAFCQDTLTIEPTGTFTLFGDQLYLTPPSLPVLDRLKIVRPGWHLGTIKKGRFEPSHAMALGLKKGQWKRSIDFPQDSPELLRYLRGESLTISSNHPNGWTIITVDHHPIGWGKTVNGQLKNHYPKGLRWI